MKLKKWLKYVDTASCKCNIWIDNDCVYAGIIYDIPYWLVDYELDDRDKHSQPICWCHKIRSTPDNEDGTEGLNGFVICLKEEED
jgi:hypothetical protein